MFNFLRRPQVSIVHQVNMCNFFGAAEEAEDSPADKDTIIALQREIADLERRNRNQAGSAARLQKELVESRCLLRELARISNEQDTLLIEKSEHTGYCGCDLEKRASIAVGKARELVGGV